MPSGWRQQGTGGPEKPWGQDCPSGDVVMNDSEFLNQSAFHSLSLHLGSQASISTSILCFP